jgi:hypothetical protein
MSRAHAGPLGSWEGARVAGQPAPPRYCAASTAAVAAIRLEVVPMSATTELDVDQLLRMCALVRHQRDPMRLLEDWLLDLYADEFETVP